MHMRCRITASLRATATVAFRYLWCREPELVRWEGQCRGAVGEPRKRPHCLMCFGTGETKTSKSRTLSSASAGLEPTSHSVTDTRIVGGGIMSKRNLGMEESSVEALARLQKQDDEFCRRLRAAIETGRECCPTTVFTEPCTNRPVSNYMRPDLIRGRRAC